MKKKKENPLSSLTKTQKGMPSTTGMVMTPQAMQMRKNLVLKMMYREDVFTPIKACEVAGVDFTSHYRWLKDDEEYRRAMDEAGENQTQRLEQRANERAVGIGVKLPSDMLMMFLLNGRRPQVYKHGQSAPVAVVAFTLNLADSGQGVRQLT